MTRKRLQIDCATSDMDAGHLESLIARTRAGGHRLAVFDWDVGLAHRYADPERDLHIDADRGNWDIFADNSSYGEFLILSGMIRPRTLRVDLLGAYMMGLRGMIEAASAEPGADLATVADIVRRCDPRQLAAILTRADPRQAGLDEQDALVVLAAINDVTRRFAKHDPGMPRVSIKRWRRSNPRSILFITAHAPLGDACPSVRAMFHTVRP